MSPPARSKKHQKCLSSISGADLLERRAELEEGRVRVREREVRVEVHVDLDAAARRRP